MTHADHGFPKSRRRSSGKSKMDRDESSMAACAKPAGKQHGATHALSHNDLVPRQTSCASQQESGAQVASEAGEHAECSFSGVREAA